MRVKIHEAKTNFSRLIEAALAGEDVVIARGDKPVVRLVPIRTERFMSDLLPTEVGEDMPDFLEPLSQDELALWEGRGPE